MNKLSSSSSPLLICKNLCKSYLNGNIIANVLRDISFSIEKKEMIAILGNSGSGKSTLLHLLAGLDNPTSGDIIINNNNIRLLSANARAELRNQELGFIYQFHHLLSDFTALENVMMPLLINGATSISIAQDKAAEMLSAVGLSHRANYKSAKLSGGERQRVAIARAIVNEPVLILADEPTGNLDIYNAGVVFDLLWDINQQKGTAFLIVTHDFKFAGQLKRILEMHNGYLQDKV